jgi:hypothetical protein
MTEKFAYNYLIFRKPTDTLLILLPMITGLVINIFFTPVTAVDSFNEELVRNLNFDLIDSYLEATNITMLILLAFFISYRWSAMLYDASYGFWITLGVNKTKFYLSTVFKFLFILFLSNFFGLIMIIYMNQMTLDFMIIIQLILLVVSNLGLYIGVAILFGNIIKNPELAALSFIIFSVLNIAFNVSVDSIQHMVFMSSFYYQYENSWLALILSLIVGVLINFITMQMHIRMDMEL